MVRFEGMWSRRAKCIFALSLSVSLLTGCSMAYIDEIRPEINRGGGLLIYPEHFEEAAEILGAQDGAASSTGGDVVLPGMGADISEGIVDPGDIADSGEGSVVGTTQASLDAQTLSATSYSKYLEQEVVQPIQTLLSGSSYASDIYFRVLHTGYDPVGADESNTMTPASPYNYKAIGGNVSGVGGYNVSQFAFDYLLTLGTNSKSLKNQRTRFVNRVKSKSISLGTMWHQVGEDSDLPAGAHKMWGNERLDVDEASLQKYLDLVESRAMSGLNGVIPNVMLWIRTSDGDGGNTSVTLNSTAGSGPRYKDWVTKAALDRLFTSYNQYDDHIVSRTLSNSTFDDCAYIWYRIDGWSKTVIIFGCSPDNTLTDLIGGDIETVNSVFNKIHSNKEWATITAIEGMQNASTIAAGARGTE